MRVQINDVGVHHAVKHERWVKGLQVSEFAIQDLHHRLFERCAELLHVSHRDRINDGLLVGEKAVERANRQPCLGGDACRCHVFQWHLLQQGTGGVQHALDGMLAALLNWHSPSRGRDFSLNMRRIELIIKGHRR